MGTLLTLWSARIAFLLYGAALAAWLMGRPRAARIAWVSGFLVYLTHVGVAFHFYHRWSHDAAYADTARQTEELLGVAFGGGLYANYVFTAVWALDVLWPWFHRASYDRRPRWAAAAIHVFMAFLFLNAAVVFVSGWARWLGLAMTGALLALWAWSKWCPGRDSNPHSLAGRGF